jgi:hypothetical protein
MPDITVSAQDDYGRILIMASWVDTPSITHGRIFRIDPDGTETLVRNNITENADGYMELSGGLMYVYDTEVPMNTAVTYRTEGYDEIAGATSTSVTWTSTHPWLKSPFHPWQDKMLLLRDDLGTPACADGDNIFFSSMEAEVRPNRSASFNVDQRKNPIPSYRVRGGISSALRLISRTFTARDYIITMNESGDPLFFQAPALYGIPDRYMLIGDYSVTRLSPDHRQEWRANLLPHVEIDLPVGLADGILGNRWVDICEPYETFQEAELAGITWSMVLLGYATDPPIDTGFRLYSDIPLDFATYADIPLGGRTYQDLLEGN